MRTLLLNPPYPLFPGESKFASPPLGLAYIAAVLEKRGYGVKILDAAVEGYDQQRPYKGDVLLYGLTNEKIYEAIADFQPDIVGISCIFSTLHEVVLDLCVYLKSKLPGLKIVLGGTHATVCTEVMMTHPQVDFVIRGEGEYAMAELLEFLSGKRAIRDVSNLTWRENNQVVSVPQKFISNIDELPFPARHLLPLSTYHRINMLQGLTRVKGRHATTAITSRGCPASCVFCSIHAVWGNKFRAHSVEYVLLELQSLKEKFGISHIVFEDDNITFDRKRAIEIFKGMIDKNFQFTWSAPNGVAAWCLDEPLLGLIRDSGCRVLFLAIESGDPETLKTIIHKPLSLEKSLEIIETCRRLGITTQAFFVIGFPGETMASMRKSMAFAEKLNVDRISVAIATPYPGTELYEICKDKGYLSKHFDITKLMTRIGQIYTSEFNPCEVEKLASMTYIRFAFRHPFKTIWRFIERIQADPLQTLYFLFKRLAAIK